MRKSLLFVLVLGVVAVMAAPALAGPDWTGLVSTEWDYAVTPGNWEHDPVDQWMTNIISIDINDVAWYGGSYLPTIDAADNTQFGLVRIRNAGTVLTQTGGTHRWMNGSGQSWGMNVYNGAMLDMTGGKHTADRIAIGGNGLYVGGMGNQPVDDGDVTANVWGTGVLQVRENPYIVGAYDLYIGTNSVIDIRDAGALEVPVALQAKVDGYIADGKIVAGEAGYVLQTEANIYGEYIVTAVIPEPGTLLLLCIGLGSLALIRRK